MKKQNKTLLFTGLGLILAFVIWTVLIKVVDVQAVGPNGSKVGFAVLNVWFHNLTGVSWTLYKITDWLGFVPIGICLVFAVLGFIQLIKRKSLLKVDKDILCLGVYYIVVILGYFIFEMIPLNYRPVIIENKLEASYPSSTTLLVLSVMPTLVFEANRRIKSKNWKCAIDICSIFFATFMVVGRAISGVHWLTDILGSIILSVGLYLIFRAVVSIFEEKKKHKAKDNEVKEDNKETEKTEGQPVEQKGNKTEYQKICQSCGMPITDDSLLGTNADGSINQDYCKYCYDKGEFIHKVSMEEFIDMCSEFGEQAGMTNEQMKEMCTKMFPLLKRWKKD